MPDKLNATIFSFTGDRTFVISPFVNYTTPHKGKDPCQRDERKRILMCVAGYLEFENRIPFGEAIINITKASGIVEQADYWHGDGIVVGIAPPHDAENLVDALNKWQFFSARVFPEPPMFVVYAPAARRYHGQDGLITPANG